MIEQINDSDGLKAAFGSSELLSLAFAVDAARVAIGHGIEDGEDGSPERP